MRRLRPGQDRAIAAGLAGRDALVVMATGSGKSLCYQAPATVLSGLTVVVSPLIALMADQLAGLERAGVAAATLDSDMPEERQRAALEGARSGAISLLYVAPERFHSASFRAALASSPIALLVVDEAHCVSEWGHEFRPDYRRVGQFRGEIGSPPTMALTATATPRVQADIARRLGLRRPVTVVGGFDRPNITFDVLWVEGKGSVAANGARCSRRWRRPAGARRSSTAAPAGRPTRRPSCCARPGMPPSPTTPGAPTAPRPRRRSPPARPRSWRPPTRSVWGSTSPTCGSWSTPPSPTRWSSSTRRPAARGATATPPVT